MFNFNSSLKQLQPGQKKTIFAPVHPLLIAYLIHHSDNTGPHILISTQKKLLKKIKDILFFFEPEQKVFSFKENLTPDPTGFIPSEEGDLIPFITQARKASKTDIFILPPQSLLKRVPSPDLLEKNTFLLRTGECLPEDFPNRLKDKGYQSRDRVEQLGQFSMRGAILDIFCSLSGPFRMELIGDEIVQIKIFDPHTQISLRETSSAWIPPAHTKNLYNKEESYKKIKKRLGLQNSSERKQKQLVHDFLKKWPPSALHQSPFGILDHFPSPLIWRLDTPVLAKHSLQEWKKEIQSFLKQNKKNPFSFDEIYCLRENKENSREIIFTSASNVSTSTSSLFTKNFFKNSRWVEKIKNQRERGMFVFISAGRESAQEELTRTLEASGVKVEKESSWTRMKEIQEKDFQVLHFIQSFTCESLMWPEGNLLFLKAGLSSRSQGEQAFFPKVHNQALHFSDLQPGDLVVHRQHGIGCFKKLELINFGTGENEFLILEYKEGDLLYVPVHSLHQVQKYLNSSFATANKHLIDKLGGNRWKATKEKVKKQIKEMTLELMNLYKLRNSLNRKKFSRHSEDFKKFETEFDFQETQDQQKAIEDIIWDLTEKEKPMDRLICGDTGFGKTEVAMRAAFKVIEDGFQVCFMAPTTILSFQQFEKFKERFKHWPVNIRLLNRFTSPKEKKQILKEIKSGITDILIGTHRILSRDIHFKKPGLLIIDEEHLFGVKSKEKIKNWHSHVDTLSLSATPIPRSLSMSLGGIRDMSLILTAPLNRKAVETVISPFKGELIKTAVLKELSRAGQIIFIHNRIADIYIMEEKLKKLLPSVRIRTAHGQMKNLQQKMVLDFFYHRFDLLLCTTIVESGMDFTNAGTLFINQAGQFGLSQLHQLRGRIGRSERPAYCYMLTDPRREVSEAGMERLKIIQENNQPGSGIQIARYDLEMRGAGELMGGEQSGFLQEVGHEMYFEFLKENISILKKEKNLFTPEPDLQFKKPAFIPKSHIPHEKARLVFYKRLAVAKSETEVEQIKTELEDFAGPLPKEVENLILLSHCRRLAKTGHIRELSHRPPYLYMTLANSTPLSVSQILKWIESGLCEWQNKETLKFHTKEDSLSSILNLLKNLFSTK